MSTTLSGYMQKQAWVKSPPATIVAFSPSYTDPLVDRFVGLGAVLQAQTPGRIVGDLGKVALQLMPSFPFHTYGVARHFIAAREGLDVGRCSAMVNSRATKADGTVVGYVGHWECVDDDAVAGTLLDAAVDWLRTQGCNEIWGPIDYSTWYTYRFSLGPDDTPPLMLEPYSPAHYDRQWRAYGFELVHTYFTAVTHDMRRMVDYSEPKLREAIAAGYSFRMLDPKRFDEALDALYDMSVVGFGANPHYTPIDRDEFLLMYGDAKRGIDPRLMIFAISPDGNIAGFIFTVPNYADSMHALAGGMAGVGGKLRALARKRRANTVLVKTIAVDAKYRSYGLGTVLGGRLQQAAIDLGYPSSHHMLIYENNLSLKMSQHGGGEIMRRYGLYQLAS